MLSKKQRGGYMDILGFFKALWSNWLSLVTGIGSLVFTVLGFVQHERLKILKNPTIQRRIYWAMAALFFFIASVGAWTDENQKVVKLDKELKAVKENKIPQLNAHFGILAHSPAGKKNENSLVIITATIKNTGAPSVADDFKVTFIAGGKKIEGIIIPPPKNTIQLWRKTEKEGEGITLIAKDFLFRKCSDQPIPTGGSCNGFLVIFVSALPCQDISNGGKAILTFKDASDREYTFESIVESNQSMPKEILIDANKLQKGNY